MLGDQPLLLMIKPPAPIARRIDRQRRHLGIDDSYGWQRLHTTLLPLSDARQIDAPLLATLRRAIASPDFAPFPIVFDKLHRNALVGSRPMLRLRAFQRHLVQRLRAAGIAASDYAFRPHLSLAYGPAPERNLAIPPVGWTVEELLLVRSIHGEGRHEELGRWPLTPRQLSLAFH